MTHLAVEEIIEFVSFENLSEDTISLSTKVNNHIRSCPNCFNKVSAFQMVYDELKKIGTAAEAKKSIYRMVDENTLKIIQDDKIRAEAQFLSEDLLLNFPGKEVK